MDILKTKDGRQILLIPSMRKIGDSKWAVYFMEDNQLYTAIYYTEEKARHRYEKELEKCTRAILICQIYLHQVHILHTKLH